MAGFLDASSGDNTWTISIDNSDGVNYYSGSAHGLSIVDGGIIGASIGL